MQRLEFPAFSPHLVTCVSTGVATIPEPLPRAARLLPVADLYLAIRASALLNRFNRPYLTISVNTRAIRLYLNGFRIVCIPSAISMIVGSKSKGREGVNAGVCLCPQPLTVISSIRIPFQKVVQRNSIMSNNISTRVAAVDPLEAATIRDHLRLRWLRSFNTEINKESS